MAAMTTWYFERARARSSVKDRVLLILPPKHVGIRTVPSFEVGLIDLYATRTSWRIDPLASGSVGILYTLNSSIVVEADMFR